MTSHKPAEPNPSDFGGPAQDRAGDTAAGAGVRIADDAAEQSVRDIEGEEPEAHPS